MVRRSVRRVLRAGCVLDVARSAIVLGGPRGLSVVPLSERFMHLHRHGCSSTLRRLRLLEARERAETRGPDPRTVGLDPRTVGLDPRTVAPSYRKWTYVAPSLRRASCISGFTCAICRSVRPCPL